MIKDCVVRGVNLKVYQSERLGSKATIIFLHDSLGSIKLWRDFPDRLGDATGCSVLVYDRQGYGESAPFTKVERGNNYMEPEADVLTELMRECNIKDAIFFGHSDGGTIALIAAAKYPTMILGVITEGAHIFVEDITVAGIQAAVNAYETTDLKLRLQKYHGLKTEAVFWAWAETWLTKEFKSWNIEAFLPQLKCPVLVIQGGNDEYGTLKQVDGIINQVSGSATKFVIPLVGHTPHKEARELVLEQSANFIAQL